MTDLLLKEELLPLKKLPVTAQEKLHGVVRIIDNRGITYGLFLDREAMEELLEDFEYASADFWRRIEASRRSGKVASAALEHRLKI